MAGNIDIININDSALWQTSISFGGIFLPPTCFPKEPKNKQTNEQTNKQTKTGKCVKQELVAMETFHFCCQI
jgi:hypothetical protein